MCTATVQPLALHALQTRSGDGGSDDVGDGVARVTDGILLVVKLACHEQRIFPPVAPPGLFMPTPV